MQVPGTPHLPRRMWGSTMLLSGIIPREMRENAKMLRTVVLVSTGLGWTARFTRQSSRDALLQEPPR
jgi:hypothetical protein